MTENWIHVYYELYFETSLELTNESINNIKTDLIEKVISQAIPQIVLKHIDIKRNLTTETYTDKDKPKLVKFRLLFIEQKKDDNKVFIIRNRDTEIDKRTFGFSPLDFYKNKEAFPIIESAILNLVVEKPTQLMTHLAYDKEGRNLIRYTDGIQTIEYVLEKKLRLYKFNKEFADSIFDGSLRDFIKWIYNKENDNDYMKKYCSEVRKMLEEQNITF